MEPTRELRIERARLFSRRWFFRECGVGLAGLALASLSERKAQAAPALNPLAPRQPHLAPKARRVIYLFMAGAPSHLDLFDYKPELARRNGQLPPKELLKDYRAAFINPNSALLGPKFQFEKHGQCGMELSELLPHTARIVDDLCFIRSMQTDAVNHAPAQILLNTGSQQFGRPSFGAWTLYGLGSESEDLPGYVVLSSAKGTSGGSNNWGAGFLPTSYAGIPFRATGDPILYLSNPPGFDWESQRASLDTLRQLNEQQFADAGDPEITARIQSAELAFRLQSSAPDLMDLATEPKHVRTLYGDVSKPGFARNCLLARRLVERGVRFVQLFHEAWDQHDGLVKHLRQNCADTDQPVAALIQDLKARGLLDDNEIWQEKAYLPAMSAIALGVLTASVLHAATPSRNFARCLCALGLIGLSASLFCGGELWRELRHGSMLFIAGSAALLLLGCEWASLSAPRALIWLARMGRLSYELYLTHMFVVLAVVAAYQRVFDENLDWGFLAYPPAIVGCVLLAAWLERSYCKPCERWLRAS